MGILNKLFGRSKEKKDDKVLPWIFLNSMDQLNEISEKSKIKTQVIFKHSTRCGISKMVMNQFVDSYNLKEEDLDLYYLDLLNHRDISGEIEHRFQVMHESPQLIVVKNKVVVKHKSHGAINEIDLEQFV